MALIYSWGSTRSSGRGHVVKDFNWQWLGPCWLSTHAPEAVPVGNRRRHRESLGSRTPRFSFWSSVFIFNVFILLAGLAWISLKLSLSQSVSLYNALSQCCPYSTGKKENVPYLSTTISIHFRKRRAEVGFPFILLSTSVLFFAFSLLNDDGVTAPLTLGPCCERSSVHSYSWPERTLTQAVRVQRVSWHVHRWHIQFCVSWMISLRASKSLKNANLSKQHEQTLKRCQGRCTMVWWSLHLLCIRCASHQMTELFWAWLVQPWYHS